MPVHERQNSTEVDALWGLLSLPTIDPHNLEQMVRVVVDLCDLDYRTVQLVYEAHLALPRLRDDPEVGRKISNHVHLVGLDTAEVKFPSLKGRLRDDMNVNTVRQYLRELGRHVTHETDVIVGGACAILLQGFPFRSTEDVDVVDEVPVEIQQMSGLVQQLSKRYGLRLTHFQSHYLLAGWENRIKFSGKYGKLQVYLVDVYDIVAGKFFSGRSKDRDDLRRLTVSLDRSKLVSLIRGSASSLLREIKYHQQLLENWYLVYGEDFEQV